MFERGGEGEGEGPIHLTEHILSGGLSTRRALRLEGCFSLFCVSLSFLSPWLDQLSFRNCRLWRQARDEKVIAREDGYTYIVFSIQYIYSRSAISRSTAHDETRRRHLCYCNE